MNSIGSWFKGDRVIWVVYFFLCIISLVEVFSAASTLAYKTGNFWSPLIKQAVFLSIGTVIVVAVHKVPCRMFKALPIIFIPVSFVLLLVTMLFGGDTNNASRWFDLGFVQFQPSELAKGAVIITVALILSQMQRKEGADKGAFKLILLVTLPICLLIFPENLSTACLLLGVVILMMFIGRVSIVQIGKLLGVLALMALLMGALAYVIPSNDSMKDIPGLHRLETWSNRLTSHFEGGNEEDDKDPAKFDIVNDAQVAHAHIAIASSNGIGRMPGNSVERDFLSQAFSDFIFAIIIEEMGFWGAFVVVFLYVVLLFRAGRIASRCERNFPPFLIMGLTLLMVSQAVLNMLVAVGILPVTGQPLPLISRGGTATLVNCVYIGMILSVSRYARQVDNPQNTRFDGSMADIVREEDRGARDYVSGEKALNA